MSTPAQPLKIWGSRGQLNPDKITQVLIELKLAYTRVPVEVSEAKNPDYIEINPNGRTPAMYDPNTDITLFESGAIIEYLIEVYDQDHHLSFEQGSKELFFAKQWLMFQVSGQAPYYGQMGWFKMFHSEKVPSALERYAKEVNRVSTVLEGQLARQKETFASRPWLVGGKMSYADLAFVSWQKAMAQICDKDEYDDEQYPLVKDWIARMIESESGKAVFEATAKLH